MQMSRFSGSAARPFLLQAQEGGFDHPAVTFMLAVIAFRGPADLDQADALARDAAQLYTSVKDDAHLAETRFLQGEIARARKRPEGRTRALPKPRSRSIRPMRPRSARADLDGADDLLAGMQSLQRALPALLATGPLDAPGPAQPPGTSGAC
ncbi:MAG: hypothetical protein IPK74_11980 [Deltaproteobacteria bacterium]|nr:hypothetical protein [Deltaproteobacteria bacterium]